MLRTVLPSRRRLAGSYFVSDLTQVYGDEDFRSVTFPELESKRVNMAEPCSSNELSASS
jgi:hypothetical protein